MAFRPGGERLEVGNDPRGITRLTRMLERSQPELIVLEASGGYEVTLLELLFAKKLAVACLTRGTSVTSLVQAGWRKPMRSTLGC